MTEKEAITLVTKKLGGYHVKLVQETNQVYLFMCEAPDPELMPSKIAVAVNKWSGKMGSSIASYEEAIRAAR